MKLTVLFMFYLLGLTACTPTAEAPPAASAVPKGNRTLGLHLTDPGNGFNSGFTAAKRIGFDSVNMHFFWGQGSFVGTLPGTPLEANTSGGCGSASTYDMSVVSVARTFYSAENKKVSMTIGTYDGPNKFVPVCASAMPFNSTTVKTMFKYLLDNVFATINASPQLELESLVIGNEVDVHTDLSTCVVTPSLSTSWAQYKEFFDEVAAYAKIYRPSLKVGVTVTHAGSIDTSKKPCITALIENADFLSLTYYGINSDFTAKSPSAVSTDFSTVISSYPGKQIYFQEIGYPSGTSSIASSEANQSAFYQNVFRAWDTYQSSIKYISIVNTHEWSDSTVDGFGVLYGLCPGSFCSAFKEFLKTLGVRTSADNGADKPAFQVIIDESKARGW